jgi:hypothetical protein
LSVGRRRVKLDFHGTRIASHAGLLAYPERDIAPGPTNVADGVYRNLSQGLFVMWSVLRTMVIAMVGTTIGIPWTPATAAECVLGAYETYFFATHEHWMVFECSQSWLQEGADLCSQADPAGGLSCVGTTTKASAGPSVLHARLFVTHGSSNSPKTGWKLAEYDVAGRKFTTRDERASMISFDFTVPGQDAALKHELRSITSSNASSVFSNVLVEAFVRFE